ncbi:hypothetical protein RLEG3_04230 (plasmid) [Rhizobium leguminosarum bv. trifolii WSM1689]|nr:hypothetical protein RLEG3_04230 [Rhizobium leguminosarum bv. trifolii WSM1689]
MLPQLLVRDLFEILLLIQCLTPARDHDDQA